MIVSVDGLAVEDEGKGEDKGDTWVSGINKLVVSFPVIINNGVSIWVLCLRNLWNSRNLECPKYPRLSL